MTTTLDIPDDLYRKVEAKAARTGAGLRDVAVSLLEGWVHTNGPSLDKAQSSAQWLNEWVNLGVATCSGLPDSPTTRDLLEEGRNRDH